MGPPCFVSKSFSKCFSNSIEIYQIYKRLTLNTTSHLSQTISFEILHILISMIFRRHVYLQVLLQHNLEKIVQYNLLLYYQHPSNLSILVLLPHGVFLVGFLTIKHLHCSQSSKHFLLYNQLYSQSLGLLVTIQQQALTSPKQEKHVFIFLFHQPLQLHR